MTVSCVKGSTSTRDLKHKRFSEGVGIRLKMCSMFLSVGWSTPLATWKRSMRFTLVSIFTALKIMYEKRNEKRLNQKTGWIFFKRCRQRVNWKLEKLLKSLWNNVNKFALIYKFQIFENTNSLIHFYMHAMKTSYRKYLQTYLEMWQQISNFKKVKKNYTKYINHTFNVYFTSTVYSVN